MRGARVFGLVLCLISTSLLGAGSARAHDVAVEETPQPEGPSILDYGWKGIFAGAFIGLGGGYLVGRRDGWHKSDWRPLGLGVAIGALAGAGLGITLGIVDRGAPYTGWYVMRDLSAGAGFGTVLGAIAGGISAAIQHKPEHVLFGMSIGVLAGAGLGIVTGVIEAVTREDPATTARRRFPHVAPTLAWTRAVDGTSTWLPGMSGRF